MKAITEVYPLLETPARIAITTHQKPDPDALGSSLALGHLLRQLGHQVTVVSPTNWADFLKWMPGADAVLDFEAQREKATAALKNTEWIFCLDYNVFERTKHLAPILRELSAIKVLIDHHQQPDTPAFTYGISDTGKSSTCEMVYDFIMAGGWGEKITVEMAACLYAGIIGDTGSFRFKATTASVHTMVAHLKKIGLQHTEIHEALYDNFLEGRLRFIGHVLSNRMEIFYEYNAALISITKADLLRFNIKTGDTEGLVNYPLSIQGIKFAGLVIDRDEERKWSFRSKGNFDVNTFARLHFEGGGHFNAAGGRSSEPLDATAHRFRNVLKEFSDQLQ